MSALDGPVLASTESTTADVRRAPDPGTTTSNRDGVGAVVEAKLGSADRRRYVGVGGVVHAYTNAGAYFGLGSEHQVDLEVTWPDGTHQEVLGVESNQVVTITEN